MCVFYCQQEFGCSSVIIHHQNLLLLKIKGYFFLCLPTNKKLSQLTATTQKSQSTLEATTNIVPFVEGKMGMANHRGKPPILKHALIICKNDLSFQVFMQEYGYVAIFFLNLNFVTMSMSNTLSKTGYSAIFIVMNNFISVFHKRPSVFENLGWWLHHPRPPLIKIIFVHFVFIF